MSQKNTTKDQDTGQKLYLNFCNGSHKLQSVFFSCNHSDDSVVSLLPSFNNSLMLNLIKFKEGLVEIVGLLTISLIEHSANLYLMLTF